MPSLHACVWFLTLTSSVSSSVLQHRAQSSNSRPNGAIGVLRSPPSLDLSEPTIHYPNITQATNVSMEHDPLSGTLPIPECNGYLYGVNLNATSCNEAWKLIPRDGTARTYGLRGNGPFDFPVPFQFMSSDGLCAVELDMLLDDPMEVATGTDVAINGLNVLRTCVEKTGRGGVTEDIGLGKRLLLEMRAIHLRDVHCVDLPASTPALTDCRAILDLIPASVDRQVFGLRNQPDVAVGLPKPFTAPNTRCAINVSTNGPSTSATWYAMYTAATAIDAMCVRQGKVGYANNIGDARNLVISIGNGVSAAEAVATA